MKAESSSTSKLHFSTRIDAPKEKVWNTMLNDDTYREWSSAFCEGAYYKGSWEKGSEIQFLGPGGQGMFYKVAENKLHEFISLQYFGLVKDGEKNKESAEAKAMAGSYENYTFKESAGATELLIDIDVSDQFKAMFEEDWKKMRC